MPDVERYSPICPLRVERPIQLHRWQTLTFLHWAYQPDVVQRLLPPGLTLETFDGKAWVGLVPFFMRIRVPGIPYLPWISNFCETNVRTYVRDELGQSGVWFFSLDAARFPAVATARLGFRLPYMWSRMTLHHADNTITYATKRRWPRIEGASRVTVDIGEPYAETELTDRDHFLTARWALFSVAGAHGWHRYARAQHDPWPLHRATVRELDDSLVTSTGLPAPLGNPLVHYSPGVDVRIGMPHRYR
ncbi:MAG: YqjF family protein [Acidothermaceae bacterium]